MGTSDPNLASAPAADRLTRPHGLSKLFLTPMSREAWPGREFPPDWKNQGCQREGSVRLDPEGIRPYHRPYRDTGGRTVAKIVVRELVYNDELTAS
jgi:hypothetical protein